MYDTMTLSAQALTATTPSEINTYVTAGFASLNYLQSVDLMMFTGGRVKFSSDVKVSALSVSEGSMVNYAD